MPFRTSEEDVTPGSGGGILPPGKHLVTVDKMEFREVGGDRKYDDYVVSLTKAGQSIRQWFSLSEASQWKLKLFLRAVSHPYKGIRIPKDIEPTDIAGRQLIIEVVLRENNRGEMRSQVSDRGMWMPDEEVEELYEAEGEQI